MNEESYFNRLYEIQPTIKKTRRKNEKRKTTKT